MIIKASHHTAPWDWLLEQLLPVTALDFVLKIDFSERHRQTNSQMRICLAPSQTNFSFQGMSSTGADHRVPGHNRIISRPVASCKFEHFLVRSQAEKKNGTQVTNILKSLLNSTSDVWGGKQAMQQQNLESCLISIAQLDSLIWVSRAWMDWIDKRLFKIRSSSSVG